MNAVLFDPTTCELLAGVHKNEGAPASLFINGEWVAAEKGETRTITNLSLIHISEPTRPAA